MALWRRKRGHGRAEGASVVAGVVAASGAAGVQHGPGMPWTIRLSLEPWRRRGGGVDERPLEITGELPRERVGEYVSLIEPLCVVALRVRFDSDLRATFIEFLGEDLADAELAERARELRQPVTMDADRFGTLTLNRSVNSWDSEQTWLGTPVRLSIPARDEAGVASALRTATALWSDQTDWDRQLRARAVADLLVLRNESWRDEGEAAVTAHQFAARMTLDTVEAGPDGAFEFWFEDGGLFQGHGICVSGTLADGLAEAEIVG